MGNTTSGPTRKRGRDEEDGEKPQSRSWWKKRAKRTEEEEGDKDHNKEEQLPPEYFVCPITRDVMVDPVMLVPSGRSYERLAVERYLRTHEYRRDPLTNEEHEEAIAVAPNRALKEAINEWRRKTGTKEPEVDRCCELEVQYPGVGSYVAVLLDAASTEAALVEAAGAVAEYCARDEPARYDAARNAGAIEGLVGMLEKSDESKAAAAFALGCACQCSELNRAAVRDCGGVPPLVALVAHSSPEKPGRVFAAGVLVSLACEAPSRQAMLEADAIRVLVQVLNRGAADAALVPAACALYNLTNDHEAGPRRQVLDHGAVPALVALAEGHYGTRTTTTREDEDEEEEEDEEDDRPNSSVPGRRGAEAAETADAAPSGGGRFLEAEVDGIQPVVVPPDAPGDETDDPLLEEEDAHDDSDATADRPGTSLRRRARAQADEVQDCAVGILLHLCSTDDDDAAKKAILEVGGFATLVKLAGESTGAVRVRALAALARAAEAENPAFKTALVGAGGLEVAVAILADRSHCRHAHFHAVVLVFHVACGAQSAWLDRLVEAGGLSALVLRVRDRRGLDGVVTMAVLALHAVTAADNGCRRTSAVQAGAVEALVDLLAASAPASAEEEENSSRADGREVVPAGTLSSSSPSSSSPPPPRGEGEEETGGDRVEDVMDADVPAERVAAENVGLSEEQRSQDLGRIREASCCVLRLLAEVDLDKCADALRRTPGAVRGILFHLEAPGPDHSKRDAVTVLRRLSIREASANADAKPVLVGDALRSRGAVRALAVFLEILPPRGENSIGENGQEHSPSRTQALSPFSAPRREREPGTARVQEDRDFPRTALRGGDDDDDDDDEDRATIRRRRAATTRLDAGVALVSLVFDQPSPSATERRLGHLALEYLASHVEAPLYVRAFVAVALAKMANSDDDRSAFAKAGLGAHLARLLDPLEDTYLLAPGDIATTSEDLCAHLHECAARALGLLAVDPDFDRAAGRVAVPKLLALLDPGRDQTVLLAALDALTVLADGLPDDAGPALTRVAALASKADLDNPADALARALVRTISAVCHSRPAKHAVDHLIAVAPVGLLMFVARDSTDAKLKHRLNVAIRASKSIPSQLRRLF